MDDKPKACEECRWFVSHPSNRTNIGVCCYFTTSQSISAVFSKMANPHVWWTFKDSTPLNHCPSDWRQQ